MNGKDTDPFKEKDTFREEKKEPDEEIKNRKYIKNKNNIKTIKNSPAEKATRLRFEEEDLKDDRVRTAAAKAEKAADKADKAVDKLPKKKTVKLRAEPRPDTGVKLKFEKAEETAPKPSTAGRAARKAPVRSTLGSIHHEIGKNEDDNSGAEAVNEGAKFIERSGYAASDTAHFREVHKYNRAEKLMERSDKANIRALYRKRRKDEPQTGSNPISRWMQKRQIRREYAVIKHGYSTGETAAATGTAAEKTVGIGEKAVGLISDFTRTNSGPIFAILALGGLLMVIMSSFSSCSVFFPGGGGAVIATTYTAEDEDILGVEEGYCAMEADLNKRISNIEREYPDYDEYNYHLDEIGHNPFELASYLTVRFEDYKREVVQSEIRKLFDLQYDLKIEEKVETRSYTVHHHETEADGSSSSWSETVYYDYYILNVTLKNKGLAEAIDRMDLDEDETERYGILMSTYGNKKYLFEDSIYAVTGEGESYEIPGEALTDERFANMIREAEKYLGYPYVWGGSSPSTSFDCSGFVSWVINNCGNGWSVGRLTANGLKNICAAVSSSEAKPGDLIFFQGTYNTTGASHVGIYVGGGMMIHCGNPIQYTSVQTSYWQSHLYGYGRLP